MGTSPILEKKSVMKRTAKLAISCFCLFGMVCPDAVGGNIPEEPGWMPHPDQAQTLTDSEKAFVKSCADNYHMEFDPERHLILGGGRSQKYDKDAPKWALIKGSVSYAVMLMDSGDEAFQQRALDILNVALPYQHIHPGCPHHGNWQKFVDTPIHGSGRVDGNQADFIALSLLGILDRHEDQLPEEMKQKIKNALLLAGSYFKSRSIGPAYTNAYVMGTLNLLAIGERYDDPELVAAGLEHLDKFYRLTMDQGSYTEYQSPNYTTVVLDVLYRLLKCVRNPEARTKGAELYYETWRQITTQYHPPTQQWSGPQLRNKGGEEILSPLKSQLIRRAVDGTLGAPTGPMDSQTGLTSLVVNRHRVPPDLRHLFLDLPQDRQVVQPYWRMTEFSKSYTDGNMTAPELDMIGTTYLHPDYSLGSVNRSHYGPERRGIMAHWGTPEATGSMIANFYKDGVLFCAPQHFGLQDKGRALYGINFATNGGDAHWFADRINGKFKASDLRLRFEFLGIGKEAKIRIVDQEQRIAEVTSGKITFRIQVPEAQFDGKPARLVKGRRSGDRQTLDLVFYQGDETEFVLQEFGNSAVGIALAVDSGDTTTLFDTLRSDIADHRLNLAWDGLELSIPTLPDTDANLHHAFQASVHGASRKALETGDRK